MICNEHISRVPKLNLAIVCPCTNFQGVNIDPSTMQTANAISMVKTGQVVHLLDSINMYKQQHQLIQSIV